ncbi:uncharacterized protein LOC135543091 [Oncorhynchus masou masou]|uniref:uncharacterized protein LOC135543091 n=1 Tax=Oncorhynchus masou masou TaxID=90313 RepID=UPI003183EB59
MEVAPGAAGRLYSPPCYNPNSLTHPLLQEIHDPPVLELKHLDVCPLQHGLPHSPTVVFWNCACGTAKQGHKDSLTPPQRKQRSSHCLRHHEPSALPLHPPRAGHLRLRTLLEAAPIRSRQAALRAWQISQLGCRPTTPSSTRKSWPARSKTSPSWLTTPVSPSQSAKNFVVALNNTLSFSANIKAEAHSCRFMLCNIRSVRPYTQVRFQAHCCLGSQFVPSNPCNLPRMLQPA